ncbi:MAG: alpha/beta fold hydrolase [Candidatus Nanopelagicales bacterium]
MDRPQTELQVVRLHGSDVAYRDLPAGAEGPASPIVALHGLGASSTHWLPAAQLLADRGHRVIVPDLPGHGSSGSGPGDYSLGTLASNVRDLLDHLELATCTLVGHSMGGGVALQFAYQFPQRLDAVALLAAGGLGTETSSALRWLARPGSGLVLAAAFNATTVGALEAAARRWPNGRQPDLLSTASLARFRELADAHHREAFLSMLRAVVDSGGQRVSAVERLSVLSDTPTLIIWGGRDHILPVAHGDRAHEALPQSTLVVLPDAGHDPHLDAPELVAELIDELARSRGPATLPDAAAGAAQDS